MYRCQALSRLTTIMSHPTRSSSRLASQKKTVITNKTPPQAVQTKPTASPSPSPATPLLFKDPHAFSQFLSDSPPSSGIFLQLSKKTNPLPTLTYDQALDVALANGWIDGQRRASPAGSSPHHFLQRFTPRRKGSTWSKRNVQIVERLIADGKMKEQGMEEVRRAKEDGRWDVAYEGSSAMTVPDDLTAALKGDESVWDAWEGMTKGERYVYLVRIETAKDARQRRQRIESCVEALRGKAS